MPPRATLIKFGLVAAGAVAAWSFYERSQGRKGLGWPAAIPEKWKSALTGTALPKATTTAPAATVLAPVTAATRWQRPERRARAERGPQSGAQA